MELSSSNNELSGDHIYCFFNKTNDYNYYSNITDISDLYYIEFNTIIDIKNILQQDISIDIKPTFISSDNNIRFDVMSSIFCTFAGTSAFATSFQNGLSGTAL